MRVYLRRRCWTQQASQFVYHTGVVINERISGSASDLMAPRVIPVVAVFEPRGDDETVKPSGEVVFAEKVEQPWGDAVSISWHRAGDSCSTVEEASSCAWAHAEDLIQSCLDLKMAKQSAHQQIQGLRSEAERLESIWKPNHV